MNLKVLRDPDDPNPARRCKMGAHVWFPKNVWHRGNVLVGLTGLWHGAAE